MSLIPTREDRAYSDGYLKASESRDKMVDYLAMQLRQAQELIGALTAERDAAARDMRERCAKAVRDTVCTANWPPEDGDELIDDLQAAIRALPLAVVATEGKTS